MEKSVIEQVTEAENDTSKKAELPGPGAYFNPEILSSFRKVKKPP
jgi:hypothetical protein